MGTQQAEVNPLAGMPLRSKGTVECDECEGAGFVSAYDVMDDVWTETGDGAYYCLSNYEFADIEGFHAFFGNEPIMLCLFCGGAGLDYQDALESE